MSHEVLQAALAESGVGAVNQDVYKTFGRHTSAGRALYKIYNKNKTSYNPSVNMTVRPSDPNEEHEAKRRAEAAALKRRSYVAPRLKKAHVEQEFRPMYYPPAKKPLDVIRAENTGVELPPSQPGPDRQAQIRRLQDAMSGANKRPAPLPGRSRKAAGTTGSTMGREKDPKQAEYDAILSEIEEREEFLTQMHSLGDDSHDAVIKGEIAQRLKVLDALAPDCNMPLASQPQHKQPSLTGMRVFPGSSAEMKQPEEQSTIRRKPSNRATN